MPNSFASEHDWSRVCVYIFYILYIYTINIYLYGIHIWANAKGGSIPNSIEEGQTYNRYQTTFSVDHCRPINRRNQWLCASSGCGDESNRVASLSAIVCHLTDSTIRWEGIIRLHPTHTHTHTSYTNTRAQWEYTPMRGMDVRPVVCPYYYVLRSQLVTFRSFVHSV